MDGLLACSALIAAPAFVAIFAGFVMSLLSEGQTWLYIPLGLVFSVLVGGLTGLMAGCTLILGAHVGAGDTHNLMAGLLHLLLYAALWLAIGTLTSRAVRFGVARLAFAAKGISPHRSWHFWTTVPKAGSFAAVATHTNSSTPRSAASACGGGIFQTGTPWATPGMLEAMKPGRMPGHGGTEEVSG